MPELPEVENTVLGLKKEIIGKTIISAWTDTPNIIKKPKNFSLFKKKIAQKKVKDILRKGKNIVFVLSEDSFLLVHMKMTGHFLFSKWQLEDEKWIPKEEGPMNDKMNLFIRVVFFFEDDTMLALSDLRKFAKIEFLEKEPQIDIGPDILKISFKDFFKALKKEKRKIKQVLMDQKIISGIGNIYSDEILFKSKIHPFKSSSLLEEKEVRLIFQSAKEILDRAIKLKGDSMSDYRLVDGKKGNYQKEHKVYRREKEPCPVCKEKIKRVKLQGRSAHFCPKCQLL